MLNVKEVHLSYGKVLALKGVTFDVNQGEVVTLIGANGAGKSSTLMTVSGVFRPHKGEINFEGQPIQGYPAHKVARSGIIQVPEGRALFNSMNVIENLEIGARATGDASKKVSNQFERIWKLFPILHQRRTQIAGTLSGGEQQMLAIGRSLMAKPKLLLMDEPSLGLAPLVVDLIFNVISQLPDQGLTILLVEQNAWMSLQVADRGYLMENGRIVLSGPSAKLLEDPTIKKIYLGISDY